MELGETWERGSNGKGQMYTCGQFMMMFSKKHHKYCKGIVLQLKNRNVVDEQCCIYFRVYNMMTQNLNILQNDQHGKFSNDLSLFKIMMVLLTIYLMLYVMS